MTTGLLRRAQVSMSGLISAKSYPFEQWRETVEMRRHLEDFRLAVPERVTAFDPADCTAHASKAPALDWVGVIIDLDVPRTSRAGSRRSPVWRSRRPPSFAPDGHEVEHLMYGYSIFICLPDGRSSRTSAATGTVTRPSRLHDYTLVAGFSEFELLPITDFSFFRFYRLN